MTAYSVKSLQEWLTWMETLHPSEIELGLSRIRTVAERLNLNSHPSKVILVAGTNGKGSFVRVLQQLLLASNVTVGAYTSPHIQSYNERIAVNDQCATDAQICEAFEAIDHARGDISLTYFEFGTLAAFFIFQKNKLDYWLCEIGLGGRLDAVNILEPDISVITSIDLDHQDWLGDTREKIAEEKCGIVREQGICVFAEPNPPSNIDAIFKTLSVNPYRINHEFSLQNNQENWVFNESVSGDSDSEQQNKNIILDELHLPPTSVAAALKTYSLCGEHFSSKQLQPKEIAEVVSTTKLAGRFQIENYCGHKVIFDVAHNPAASVLLVEKLRDYSSGGQQGEAIVTAIVGMMADKDIYETLRPLVDEVNHWCVASIKGLARSASGALLESTLYELGVNENSVSVYTSIEEAFHAASEQEGSACENIQPNEKFQRILLCMGSFFTVSPLLDIVQSSHKNPDKQV